MVKSTSQPMAHRTPESGVRPSVAMKKPSALREMLRTYAARMREDSPDADAFFKTLKTELTQTLSAHGIKPPTPLHIIVPEAAQDGEQVHSIGIPLYATSTQTTDQGQTFAFSEYLQVTTSADTDAVQITPVVLDTKRIAAQSIKSPAEIEAEQAERFRAFEAADAKTLERVRAFSQKVEALAAKHPGLPRLAALLEATRKLCRLAEDE